MRGICDYAGFANYAENHITTHNRIKPASLVEGNI